MKKLLLSVLILSLISVSNTTYPMAARIGQKVAQNAAKNPNSILGKAMQTVMKKAGLSPETKNTIQPLQPLVAVKPQAKSVNYKNSTITDAEKITQQVKSVAATEKQLLTKLDKKSNIKPLIKSFNKTAFKKNIVRPTVGKFSAIAANSLAVSSAAQQESNASKNVVISDPLNNHRRLIILPDSLGVDACASNGSGSVLSDFIADGTTSFLVHKNCIKANAAGLRRVQYFPFDMYEVSDSYILLIPQKYTELVGNDNLGFNIEQLKKVTINQYHSTIPSLSVAADWILPLMQGNKGIEYKFGQNFIESIEKLFNTADAKKYKWDFVIAGHASARLLAYTCGISEKSFKQFLSFAHEKINTNSLAYASCWSGGSRFNDLFDRTYNYPIMCVGGIDGVIPSGLGYHLRKPLNPSKFQGYWDEVSNIDTLNAETLKQVLSKISEYPSNDINRVFIREAHKIFFEPVNYSENKPLGAVASQAIAQAEQNIDCKGILFVDTPVIEHTITADHIRSMSKHNAYYIKHIAQRWPHTTLEDKIRTIIEQFDFEEAFGATIRNKIFYIDKLTFKGDIDSLELNNITLTLKSNWWYTGDYTIIYRDKNGFYSKVTASRTDCTRTHNLNFNLEVLNPTESKKYEAEYLHNKQKISPEL